jgi:hypothetical protein
MFMFIGLMACSWKESRAVRLTNLVQGRSEIWEWLWFEGERVKQRMKGKTVSFMMNGTLITDNAKAETKKEFEDLVRLSLEWYTTHIQDVEMEPYNIRWTGSGRSIMSYKDSTLFILDEAFRRFSKADIVLSSIHEIIGHHHQESLSTFNLAEQKETCAMACEESLRSVAPVLVDKWRLLRLVRALIDIKVNHANEFDAAPSVEHIYQYFDTTMMSLETILNTVTIMPGYGLAYFYGDTGNYCACDNFVNKKHL